MDMTDDFDPPIERSYTLPSRPPPTNVNGITTNESVSPHHRLQRSPTYGPGTQRSPDARGFNLDSSGPSPSLPAISQTREPPYPVDYPDHPYTPTSLVPPSSHGIRDQAELEICEEPTCLYHCKYLHVLGAFVRFCWHFFILVYMYRHVVLQLHHATQGPYAITHRP